MRELNCHFKKTVIYILKKLYCKYRPKVNKSKINKIKNILFVKVFVALIFNILIKINY